MEGAASGDTFSRIIQVRLVGHFHAAGRRLPQSIDVRGLVGHAACGFDSQIGFGAIVSNPGVGRAR